MLASFIPQRSLISLSSQSSSICLLIRRSVHSSSSPLTPPPSPSSATAATTPLPPPSLPSSDHFLADRIFGRFLGLHFKYGHRIRVQHRIGTALKNQDIRLDDFIGVPLIPIDNPDDKSITIEYEDTNGSFAQKGRIFKHGKLLGQKTYEELKFEFNDNINNNNNSNNINNNNNSKELRWEPSTLAFVGISGIINQDNLKSKDNLSSLFNGPEAIIHPFINKSILPLFKMTQDKEFNFIPEQNFRIDRIPLLLASSYTAMAYNRVLQLEDSFEDNSPVPKLPYDFIITRQGIKDIVNMDVNQWILYAHQPVPNGPIFLDTEMDHYHPDTITPTSALVMKCLNKPLPYSKGVHAIKTCTIGNHRILFESVVEGIDSSTSKIFKCRTTWNLAKPEKQDQRNRSAILECLLTRTPILLQVNYGRLNSQSNTLSIESFRRIEVKTADDAWSQNSAYRQWKNASFARIQQVFDSLKSIDMDKKRIYRLIYDNSEGVRIDSFAINDGNGGYQFPINDKSLKEIEEYANNAAERFVEKMMQAAE